MATTLGEVANDPRAPNALQADYLLREQAGNAKLLEHFMYTAVAPCLLAASTAPGTKGMEEAEGSCCSSSSSSSSLRQ